MQIRRIINNNFAVILDGNKQEKVVMGKGISFGRKVGDWLDESSVEKEYMLVDKNVIERFTAIVKEVNPGCLRIAEYIIDKAEKTLSGNLNENIYVSLTDHIHFTINRYHQGLQLKNDMLWHIKRMYPKEYELGEEALDLIEEEFGIRLLEDESSFIAMHIVAARTNEELSDVVNVTKTTKDIMTIVSNHFNTTLDDKSIYYERFVTHLKFFAQRLANNQLHNDDDNDEEPMFVAVKNNYPEEFECAKKIGVYVKRSHKHNITNEELLYLTIHIKRMIMKE